MRRIAWLSAVALSLAAAFFFAPALVVGRGLATIGSNVPLALAFADNLIAFWNAGSSDLTPGLVDLVDLWRRWHAMKIAISALFTVTMVGLTAAWWARFLAAGATRRQRLGRGTAAGLATVLTLCGTVAIVANIQATAAPLSALLPLLPSDPPPGALRLAMTEIRDGLADPGGGFAERPALAVVIDSQRTYLTALAVTTVVVAAAFAGTAGYIWRMLRTTSAGDRLRRGTLRGFVIGAIVVTAMTVGAAVAAWRAVADPAASLLGIFTVG
ncbi:MAG: hypothetical protein AB1925_14050 [Actinomycetota bacterium]